ncbi:putative ribonuclease II RNB family protein [Neospora caninum Liverpool]|uniref:Putative ribonuclease II RNB family protein n=1 Tax=Neospora caninum (strain Liverpool) TaxID=572307 RepID=F0VFD6_NEOCL|nr:putative ribonuclease II RNB family protein [Neospora caninum Liverpool]CBZ52430.1 putative ribonuclease II RNB family protein [Neospora caninum Liverpool]|eukprot:XP_003882462.1 putative ribonuclease II RNB family protein [Neospora caninum Liverpool]
MPRRGLRMPSASPLGPLHAPPRLAAAAADSPCKLGFARAQPTAVETPWGRARAETPNANDDESGKRMASKRGKGGKREEVPEADAVMFEQHWSEEAAQEGLKRGLLVKGLLQIPAFQTDRSVILVDPSMCPPRVLATVPHKRVRSSAAAVSLPVSASTPSSSAVPGTASQGWVLQFDLGGFLARNRALHGDIVAVTFLPRFYSERVLRKRKMLFPSASSDAPSSPLSPSSSHSSTPASSAVSSSPSADSAGESHLRPHADPALREGPQGGLSSSAGSSPSGLQETPLRCAESDEHGSAWTKEEGDRACAEGMQAADEGTHARDASPPLELLPAGRVVRILAFGKESNEIVCVVPPQQAKIDAFLRRVEEKQRNGHAAEPRGKTRKAAEKAQKLEKLARPQNAEQPQGRGDAEGGSAVERSEGREGDGGDRRRDGETKDVRRGEPDETRGSFKMRASEEDAFLKAQPRKLSPLVHMRRFLGQSGSEEASRKRGKPSGLSSVFVPPAEFRDSRLPPFLVPIALLFDPPPSPYSDELTSPRSPLPPSSLPLSSLPSPPLSSPPLSSSSSSLPSSLSSSEPGTSASSVWTSQDIDGERRGTKRSAPREADAHAPSSVASSPLRPSALLRAIQGVWAQQPTSTDSSLSASALVVLRRGPWVASRASPFAHVDAGASSSPSSVSSQPLRPRARCLGGKGSGDILAEALATLHMEGLPHAWGFPLDVEAKLNADLTRVCPETGRPLWLVSAERDPLRLDCRPPNASSEAPDAPGEREDAWGDRASFVKREARGDLEKAPSCADTPASSLASHFAFPSSRRALSASSNSPYEAPYTTQLRAFTIDPPTAKDLDDAISVVCLGGRHRSERRVAAEATRHGSGDTPRPTEAPFPRLRGAAAAGASGQGYSGLGEASIQADCVTEATGGKGDATPPVPHVSHFVEEGSALDAEAAMRATTVYLDAKVFPMLPPALSEGVCSLHSGVDRLAFSVFMTLNEKGELLNPSVRPPQLAKTIIRTAARLDYAQVDSFLLAVPGSLGGFLSSSPFASASRASLLWDLLVRDWPRMPSGRGASEPGDDASFWKAASVADFPRPLRRDAGGGSAEEARLWRGTKEAVKALIGEIGVRFDIPAPVAVDLITTYFLTLRRQRRRQKEGAIHLSSSGRLSLYFASDKETLRPVSLLVRESNPLSHLLVEESMVLANHCVAEEILAAQREASRGRQAIAAGHSRELEGREKRGTETVEGDVGAMKQETKQREETEEDAEARERRGIRGGEKDACGHEREKKDSSRREGEARVWEQRDAEPSRVVSKEAGQSSERTGACIAPPSRREFGEARGASGEAMAAFLREEERNRDSASAGEGKTTEPELPKPVAFGGLLRAHAGSNDGAIRFLRDTLDPGLWEAFQTHMQAAPRLEDALKRDRPESRGESNGDAGDDQDDVSGIKLSHLLEFCKARLSAPVYNALCFSVLQEFFLQAQYVSPAVAARQPAAPPSGRASKDRKEQHKDATESETGGSSKRSSVHRTSQPADLGHWALCLSSYMHFTSPIRRYADLHVHRLLSKRLRGEALTVPVDTLEAACRQCNENSRRADSAQVAFRSWYFNAFLREFHREGLLYSEASILKIVVPASSSSGPPTPSAPSGAGDPAGSSDTGELDEGKRHEKEGNETRVELNADEDAEREEPGKTEDAVASGEARAWETPPAPEKSSQGPKRETHRPRGKRQDSDDTGRREQVEGETKDKDKIRAALVIYIPLLQATRSVSLATLGLEIVEGADVKAEEHEERKKQRTAGNGTESVSALNVRRLRNGNGFQESDVSAATSRSSLSKESARLLGGAAPPEPWGKDEVKRLRALSPLQVKLVPGETQWSVRLPFWLPSPTGPPDGSNAKL